MTPPGPGFPVWKGFDAIFPALNAAAEKHIHVVIRFYLPMKIKILAI